MEPSVRHAVEHAAHLLPAQGPIGIFVHHNTLHAFQHMPFEEAVVNAGETFGAQPYMTEEQYAEAVSRGRIKREDIGSILWNEPDGPVWPGMRRHELRQAMLTAGVREFHPETVQWELKNHILDGPGGRELFPRCLSLIPVVDAEAPKLVRPRAGVLALTGIDIDDIVHSWLIRLTASFLDQGLAYWPMPDRETGLFAAAIQVLRQPFVMLPPELARLHFHIPPEEPKAENAEGWVERALELLGVAPKDWEALISAELLALPGWPGMVRQLEMEPALAPLEVVPAKLMDFVALRLLLTVTAVESALGDCKKWQSATLPAPDGHAIRLARAATLFDIARKLDVSAEHLPLLARELEAFPAVERRRVLHMAYERRHEREVLVPLLKHRRAPALPRSPKLKAQVFFCIDEREESMRRHLEEIAPEVETFGAAGFFGVAMSYTGADDALGMSLCPVVVKPKHAIKERPVDGDWGAYARRTRLRRAWAYIQRHWFVSSRTMIRGWLGTTLLGPFNIIPLAARVLNPRGYARLVKWLNDSIVPQPRTELAFERQDAVGHAETFELANGFTVDEKADRVAAMLGNAGLRRGMARLVVILGHGSTSVNNPHESAYNCGACGGSRGGPNARLFALMANHPGVRERLRQRGVIIPDDTWFLGGYHDTGNDAIEFFDAEDVPRTHRRDVAEITALLDEARARNAHERTRRFVSAGWPKTPMEGLIHVEERTELLSEARPECGHGTNAVCIVGRRDVTRGLFLDRRAFLVSYDAAQDPTDAALAAQLGAAIPVCGGISLEYYFSYVDNERYGCGTKLPHNLAGLVGVMNGYEGDLRTGLPWQMVEIHEPVRILFVIETTPARLMKVVHADPQLTEFVENRWIRVAVMDPASGDITMYRSNGVWEPVEGGEEMLGRARSSMEWYKEQRENLPIARIEPENPKRAAHAA